MTEALYGFLRRRIPMKERFFYANQNVSQFSHKLQRQNKQVIHCPRQVVQAGCSSRRDFAHIISTNQFSGQLRMNKCRRCFQYKSGGLGTLYVREGCAFSKMIALGDSDRFVLLTVPFIVSHFVGNCAGKVKCKGCCKRNLTVHCDLSRTK